MTQKEKGASRRISKSAQIDTGEAETFTRYFENVARLALAVNQNIKDYEFSTRDSGRIHYVVDANLVYFFMQPEIEPGHVRTFWLDRALEQDTAIITVEHLFSGKLAGQFGDPLLISNEHASEVFGKINHQTLKLRTYLEHQQIKKMSEVSGDHAAAVKDVVLYNLLINEGRLKPISSVYWATSEIIGVDKKSETYARIKIAIKSAYRAAANATPKTVTTLNDTETLCQLIGLNRYAAQISPPTRFVLVTADKHLHNALADLKWNLIDGDRSWIDLIELRHPIQYLPLLNISEMPTGVNDIDVIYRLRDSLDVLLSNIRTYDWRYPEILDWYLANMNIFRNSVIESLFLGDVIGQQNDRAGEMLYFHARAGEAWQAASENARDANRELLSRRRAVEEKAADIVKTDRVEELLFHVDNVSTSHVGIMVGAYCLHFVNAIRPKNTYGRMPLAVHIFFEHATRGKPVDEFLDGYAALELKDRTSALIERLHEESAFSRRLFLGCLAMRASLPREAHGLIRDGFAAVGLLDLALQKRWDEICDFQQKYGLNRLVCADGLYLLAATCRLCLAGSEGYSEAMRCIHASDALLDKDDEFGRWRNNSERLANWLFHSYAHQLNLKPSKIWAGHEEAQSSIAVDSSDEIFPAPPTDINGIAPNKLLAQCMDLAGNIQWASSKVRKSISGRTGNVDVKSKIELQLLTNVLSYYIYCRGLDHNLATIDDKHVEHALHRISTLDNGEHLRDASITHVEHLAARYLRADRHDIKIKLRDELLCLAAQVKSDVTKHVANVQGLDLREIEYLTSERFLSN